MTLGQEFCTLLALGVLIMCAGAGLMALAERRAGRRWGK